MTRTLLCCALLMMAGCAMAQTGKEPDPCFEITDKYKAEMEKFNRENKDGIEIMLSCFHKPKPVEQTKAPIIVYLPPKERLRLKSLQDAEVVADKAVDEYEKRLFLRHKVEAPEYGKHCYYVVGAIWSYEYVSYDTTFEPSCAMTLNILMQERWAQRWPQP